MTAEFPSTVHRWLGHMAEHGPSNRPIPKKDSDLLHPATYEDPLDIKPERVALAAIFSVRAYQHAKNSLQEQAFYLTKPSSALITDPITLIRKSEKIGVAFTDAMIDGVIKDEAHIKKLPEDHILQQNYRRLNEILEPVIRTPDYVFLEDVQRVIAFPSASFVDIYGGLGALPGQINGLLKRIPLFYFQEQGEMPSTQTILDILRNSYDTQIKPFASFHKADGEHLQTIDNNNSQVGRIGTVSELEGDSVQIRPERVEEIRSRERELRTRRSKKTRCAFLVNTGDLEPFVDTQPDFEDPLRDAYNLYVDLLAA